MSTNPTRGAPGSGAQADFFDLQIGDPAALLNEIARRYESLARIFLEYPDNALDDAEDLFRAHGGAYPQTVRIKVSVDARNRTVTIRDNCRGMDQATLERIVRNVGQSTKKGMSWLNGQFGFGVHAFRAAAHSIRFRTRQRGGPHLELTLTRDQHQGIRRPHVIDDPFPSDTGTGTEVAIGPIDPEWLDGLTGEQLRHEIELHFERLLARPNLEILVQEVGKAPLTCAAFEYRALAGTDFQRQLTVRVGSALHAVHVHLKVTDVEFPNRAARFFARGRRINDVARVASFLRKSEGKVSLWGHPHLIGYIEVGEVVQPMITRDDFKNNAGRRELYRALMNLEDDVRDALDKLNETRRVVTLNRLEDVLRNILDDLAREDRLRFRTELRRGDDTGRHTAGGGADDQGVSGHVDYESKRKGGTRSGAGEGLQHGPDTNQAGESEGTNEGGDQIEHDPSDRKGAEQPKAGFDIRFMNLPPDAQGGVPRSHLLGGTIFINTEHPDFHERTSHTRQGRPKVNNRLCAYLAAVISAHYKDQFYLIHHMQPNRAQVFEDQVEFICRFETALQTQRQAVETAMAGGASAAEESDEDAA